MDKTSFRKGTEFTLLSASALSLVGLFAKLGSADLPVSALIFWRFLIASLLYFITLWMLGRLKDPFHFKFKDQALRALFVLSAQYCFFYYLKKDTLLNASALLNTGPMFISIIEWGILRQKVGVSSWIGSSVAFVGALFILQPDISILSWMSLIGLLSGLSQGASQVQLGRTICKERAEIDLLHLLTTCTLFSSIPFALFHESVMPGVQFSQIDLIWLGGLGVMTILNQLFRGRAYQYATPSRVSSFLYFSVLLAGVWDWTIFGNTPDLFSGLGASLIVLGGILKVHIRNRILKKQKDL